MAIAKVSKKKLELTPQAMIELGIAAGLVIVSFLLLWLGVNRWLLKRSIVKALELHDQNNPGLVAEECRSALAKDDQYHIARQLLAKVLVDDAAKDASKLNEAEKEYQALLAAGYDKSNAHVGLGVISLIRADQATDPKQIADHVAKARSSFDAARKMDSACLEAEIGMANAKLLLAVKTGGDLSDARKDFEKLRAKIEKQGTVITKAGLVDFYSGFARTMAGSGNWNDASRCYRICYLYAPEWELPLVNLAYTDAERYATQKFTKEQLESDPTLKNFTIQLQNMSVKSEALKEVHTVREMALSIAFGQADQAYEVEDRLRRLESAYPNRLDILFTKAWIWLEIARRVEPGKQGRIVHVGRAATAIKQLLELKEVKEGPVEERIVLLNSAAVMLEAAFMSGGSEPQLYEAETFLREAIKLDKDGRSAYVLHRNLAAVLKRIRVAPNLRTGYTIESLTKDIDAEIQAAGAAAGAEPADLARLKEWNP